ncbi:MAG: PAS domain S-box protein [Bdellovibrionaceae bacterium]|nr:PAS domain S-box protein [Bdellovibrio sp.]
MKNQSQELFEKYQKALEAAGVGLWELNVATGLIKWDTGLQKLYQLDDKILEGDFYALSNLIHEDDRSDMTRHLELAIQDQAEVSSTFRIILPNKTIRYIRSQGYKIRNDKGEVIGLVGISRDISDEKLLQINLNQTKNFLASVTDAMPDPLLVKNSQHQWIFANAALEKLLGKSKADIIGKNDYDLFPTESAELHWRTDNEALASNEQIEQEEKIIDANGAVRDVLVKKNTFMFSGDEKVIVASVRDITEKNNSDSRFRLMISLIDSSVDFFGFANQKGVPLYVNKTGQDVFGIEIGSKKYFADYLSPDDKFVIDENIVPRLKAFDRWEGEVTAINPKTKAEIPVLVKVFAVKTGPSNSDIFYGCSGTSLVQMKAIQRSMVEQSKMASLGEMAAEMAHEVNNPLMIIQAKSHMLQAKVGVDNPDRDKIISDLQLIEKNSQRIDRIIKSLKTASRNSEQDPYEEIPLLDLIDEALEISTERFRSNFIKIEVINNDVCDRSHIVNARSSEIVQVLVNLLNNSFDAVKTQTNRWVQVVLSCSEAAYLIEIIDSGPRITKDVSEKMMRPFFTTKAMGHGTGLGLSLSKQIIQNHEGDLYYDGDHVNTRFIFTLKKLMPAK